MIWQESSRVSQEMATELFGSASGERLFLRRSRWTEIRTILFVRICGVDALCRVGIQSLQHLGA
jgi:hypothetical protein